MSEENVNVEEIVEEVIEEQQPMVEGEVAEEAPNLDIDFSSFVPEEAPYVEPEVNYDSVIEGIVEKVLDKQKIKSVDEREDSDDDDMEYLSKKDLAEYTKKIQEEVFGKIQQQQQAETTIRQSYEQSQGIVQNYTNNFISNLSQRGIDLEANPMMKTSADLLLTQLKINYANSVGRMLINPLTGKMDPVLSQQETGRIVKQHWEIFSKNYLPAIQPAQRAGTAPLGAGNAGIPGEAQARGEDEYSNFLAKKAAGTETMQDALSLLLKGSQKK
tara:strand:+ start:101 stop:916 length:816 start_codon:yes stop_codon:yes gene_type:complete